MKGDDRVRHCLDCNLNVYNLSAMTDREAQTLVAGREGRLCVRFYQRKDGTVLTQNCPVGVKAVVRRISRVAGAVFSAMSVSLASTQTPTLGRVQVDQREAGFAITVLDVTGAVCAHAQVELVNDIGKTRTTGTTNADGQFRLSHLTPGTYVLTVQLPGFQTHVETIKIKEHKLLKSTVTLRIAIMGEVVEVKR